MRKKNPEAARPGGPPQNKQRDRNRTWRLAEIAGRLTALAEEASELLGPSDRIEIEMAGIRVFAYRNRPEVMGIPAMRSITEDEIAERTGNYRRNQAKAAD